MKTKCIDCGCTDGFCCKGGCKWEWVDKNYKKGLCSACRNKWQGIGEIED